ncbi:hypothetical protein [Actinomyces vulturis]|uniref:hypothetical protein n=1 Tax=Actinomyces vulturis TaxID=1857645 RepID=UPI000832D474|nr:hypothetical protein [Actinomyces vulturis]
MVLFQFEIVTSKDLLGMKLGGASTDGLLIERKISKRKRETIMQGDNAGSKTRASATARSERAYPANNFCQRRGGGVRQQRQSVRKRVPSGLSASSLTVCTSQKSSDHRYSVFNERLVVVFFEQVICSHALMPLA